MNKNPIMIIGRLLCSRSHRSTPTGRIHESLSRLFEKHLFLTNTFFCGFMMAGGDLIQQQYKSYKNYNTTQKKTEQDWTRTGRMFVVGLFQGPVQHFFYLTLDRYIPGRDLKRSVPLKILADQIIGSPIFISIFFLGIGLMEGRTLSKDVEEMKKKFITVYKMDCTVWPPMQFINFYFLPLKYRVIYINLVLIMYNGFLSYIHHDTG